MIAVATLHAKKTAVLAELGMLDVNYQEMRSLLHQRALFLQREINELESGK